MEGLYKNEFRIKSARHPDWDYSTNAWYFITICCQDKRMALGEIKDKGFALPAVRLSTLGIVVRDQLLLTASLRTNIELDEWVIMPNHLHFVIIFNEVRRDASHASSLQAEDARGAKRDACDASLQKTKEDQKRFGPQSNNLAAVIRGFKAKVQSIFKKKHNINNFWQSNYYDRIIRSEKELENIRSYIRFNPLKWQFDQENPNGLWRI